MRSNCVLFAVRLWLRRTHRRGREGYLMWRWSRWGPFPHVLYAEKRATGTWRVVSFKPAAPRPYYGWPPMFVGSIKWGD